MKIKFTNKHERVGQTINTSQNIANHFIEKGWAIKIEEEKAANIARLEQEEFEAELAKEKVKLKSTKMETEKINTNDSSLGEPIKLNNEEMIGNTKKTSFGDLVDKAKVKNTQKEKGKVIKK